MKSKLLLIIFTLFSISTNAQNLEETLSKLSSTAGKAYIAPVITAFGSNLNSGWVSALPVPTKLGFHIDIKVVAMGSLFSDENKTFSTTGNFYFTSSQADQILLNSGVAVTNPLYNSIKNSLTSTEQSVNFSGPTVAGSKNEYLKIVFPGKNIQGINLATTSFSIKEITGLLDEIPIFPTVAPQLTVGTFMGTNVSFRYLPDVELQDLGKFSFFGIGAVHNIGAWFPNPLPVDFGVGYFTQNMKVGSIMESSASQFGLYVSKTFGIIVSFTPYAGIISEQSKTTITYDYQSNQVINGVPVPPAKINFELEGENKTGVLIGFKVHLAAVNINADYKMSKTKTASVGLSLGL